MSESKPGIVSRIFSGLWRGITLLRVSLSNIIFILLIVIIVAAATGGAPVPLQANTALVLNPSGSVVEQLTHREPVELLLDQPGANDREVLLQDIVDAIEAGAADDAISTLVLRLDRLSYVGISKSLEIVEAIDGFKATGKPVVAVGDYYSQDQYLLASHADEVHLHNEGSLLLEGYGAFRNYFASALEKLKVDVNVFVAGTYKDALEPFLRDGMSEEERVANLAWLDSLWGQYTQLVEVQRQLPAGSIDNYIENLESISAQYQGHFGEMALSAGLIDSLKSRSEMQSYLNELVGATDDDGEYRSIDFESYLSRYNGVAESADDERIGVVVARGFMLDGDQPPGVIGGDSLADLIRQAREDEVAALLLRVDTGGGSTFASHVIREEILATKAQGIPIVVSMGAMAASGGYWIAMDADRIIAQPSTLTGSIGAFSVLPTFERSLAALGVSTDGVGTTSLAGGLRGDRELHPTYRSILQHRIEMVYDDFIEGVSTGRGLSAEATEAAAQGRVWSGAQALELGLVDELGGFDRALEIAAELGGLDSPQWELFEQQPSPGEMLVRQLMESAGIDGIGVSLQQPVLAELKGLLQPLTELANMYESLNDPGGLYTRCMMCVAP